MIFSVKNVMADRKRQHRAGQAEQFAAHSNFPIVGIGASAGEVLTSADVPPPAARYRLAWLPIPILLLLIVGLWVLDLRGAWPQPVLSWLIHFAAPILTMVFVGLPAGRTFLATGQPGALMIGTGVLISNLGATASGYGQDLNTVFAIYNPAIWLSALCHFFGIASVGRRIVERRQCPVWLTVAYASGSVMVGLLVWAARAGRMPVFFIAEQGSTVVRDFVVLSAVGMFGLTAGLMWRANRRTPTPFLYWYALGLLLLAAGLAGSLLIVVQDSLLQWITRSTQAIGGIYLCVAVWATARASGTKIIPLDAVAATLRADDYLALWRQQPWQRALRYGSAVVAVVVAFGAREALAKWAGPGFRVYLTFYPAIMVVALLAGYGPGLLATGLSVVTVAYWILPPTGFAVGDPMERVGLAVFAGMGVFMSVFAEVSQRYRRKAEAYDRETALRASQARLAAFAEATFEGIVESDANRIVDCNEQFARMLGYTVAELKGSTLYKLIVPADRERVRADVEQHRDAVLEYGMLRNNGTHIIVETHGRPVFPGSLRRHMAVHDITARKQAEYELQLRNAELAKKNAELRASEQRERARATELAVILDTIPTPVITVHDSDSHRMTGNRAAAELLRIHAGGEISLSASGEAKPDHFKTCKDGRELRLEELPAHRAARGEHVKDFEFNLVFDDGTVRDLLGYGTPLPDEQGQPRGAVNVLVDITERKQAEAVLKQNEARYRTLTEKATDMVCVVGASGAIMYESPNQQRILGYRPGELLEHNIFELIHPTDQPQVMALFQAGIRQTGVVLHAEAQVLARDGTWRWLDTTATNLLDDPAIHGVVLNSRDITERKQAESALQRSDEQLRRAQEIAHLGSWDLDLIENRLTWSDEVYRIFGLQPQEFGATYEAFLERIHPDDRAKVDAAYSGSLRDNRDSYEIEHRIIRKDTGAIRIVQERCQHFRDTTGKTIRSGGMVQDITERKQAEDKLHRLNRTLLAFNDSDRALLQATAEPAYLAEVCRIIVEDCGHAMVWVGFAENDAAKTVRPVVSAGFEAGYLDALQITWADTERGRGPTGTAIRTGLVSQCRNMQTDPQLAPWRAEAIKRGYASSAAFPLLADGKAFGVVTVYSPKPDGFDDAEVELLIQLAGDFAHGITTLRLRAAHAVAEAALRDREEQLRLFAEHAPAAIAMFDTQMRYIAASQRWLADFGFAGQDLHGRSHYEMFPEIPDRWREIHRRCLAGAIEHADEDQFVRADGQTQWIRWEIRPWHTEAGVVSGIIIFSEDITARKQTEANLRLQTTALQAAANAIAIIDRTGTIQWINEAFTRLTGYSAAEVIGANPRVLKSGQHPAEFYAGLWATVTAGHAWHGELVNKRKDGSLYSEEMTITPVRNDAGTITHFIAIKQDITDRRQAEETLQLSEERYRLLFENMQEGFAHCQLIYDVDGRPVDFIYLDVNDSFGRLTGLTDVVGKRVSELLPGLNEVHPELLAAYARVAQTAQPERLELEFKPLGRWLTLSIYSPHEDHFAVSFDDITNRKHAEERVKASLAENEVLLREIHHRVKNNLQVISSLVSLQSDNLTDNRLRDVFGDVRDRVRTMALVHEQLYQADNLAKLNFADYAANLLNYLWRAHSATAGNVGLKLAVAPVLLSPETAIPCGLILNELAINALKYGFPNGRRGEVTVSLNHDSATGAVSLRVHDNGVGLPAGLDWRQATSLGLRLVQMLAGQLHGTVGNGPGPGTEFHVDFFLKNHQNLPAKELSGAFAISKRDPNE